MSTQESLVDQVLLPQIWATNARVRSDQTALICAGERRTWKALNAGMNRVAHALIDYGINRGDRVAVLMANAVDTVEIMFGIVKAGACLVPLSGLLTPEQIAGLLADSGAQMLFACPKTHDLVEPVRDAIAAKLVSVRFEAEGWQPFATFTKGAEDTDPTVVYAEDDSFSIIYSSGTTGLPKGIVHSHRARLHWSWSNALEMRFTNSSIALATTSLYSNGTWFMMLPTLLLGGTVIVMDRFSPDEFLEIVEREKVTHSFVVPAQCSMILADPACGHRDLTSLQMLLSAGSALRTEVRREVERTITPRLFELYGFSEGFASIIGPEEARRHPGSVGKPVVGFDFRILDEDGREVPPGDIGEIAGTGGGVMRHYHGKPDQTQECLWTAPDGRIFVRGGDLGRTDKDGNLYILDRKKDMILSGGFNVFPADIEEIVSQHPDVQDVTVIGVPHPRWDECPLALIIPRKGAQPDAEAILAWANDRLSKTQRLSGVEFRDEFPRNALGKVLKRSLRQPYWPAS